MGEIVFVILKTNCARKKKKAISSSKNRANSRSGWNRLNPFPVPEKSSLSEIPFVEICGVYRSRKTAQERLQKLEAFQEEGILYSLHPEKLIK
ncbi:MAG: hypothetical protein ACFFB3_01860 [Candidatus Hodarchaeota archaeon]